MVLSSQAPRPDSPSAYVSIYRLRRRRRNRLLGFLMLLLVPLGAAVYALWPSSGEGRVQTPTRSVEPAPETMSTSGVARERVEVQPSSPGSPISQSAAEQPASQRPAPTPEPSAPPPPAPPQSPNPKPVLAAGDPQVARVLAEAQTLTAADKLLQARELLNRAYVGQKLTGADAAKLRQALNNINDVLIFSPRIVEGDPHVQAHIVQPGEYLSTIAAPTQVPWQLVARINKIDPNRIRAGARIKLVRGPFHAVVDKSDYRMDLYLGDPTQPGSMFVRSFEVGHGEGDSTPVGRFIVKRGGKLENPDWRNPRNSSEYYAADDPKNPIGDRWIGLRGLDASTEGKQGYGIHGTIEPGSIGRQASMGCVRMRDADVALVFDMLTEEKSTVTIVP